MISLRTHRKHIVVAVICLTLLLLVRLQLGSLDPLKGASQAYKLASDAAVAPEALACSKLPGANETLVIMKTGSTELQDKLPIHLRTTLRCYPNYIIYSDVAEEFEGHAILDALEDVNPDIKATHDDFALYRRLQQESGRAALQQSEMSGPSSTPQGMTGKADNPGWKLDKWKFLPMMRATLEQHPDKHWYIFVETDTHLLWNTLLAYINVLDWTKPYYIGGQTWIGDVEFAHGGSGYLVSRSALEMVVKQYVDNQREWETFTDGHWAGDCVLGKAFKDAGISLTAAWPIWQGDDIGNMNYGHSQKLWCQPTVSYHHMGAAAIEELWDYEQEWASSSMKVAQPFLRHKDIFAEYILPRTTSQKSDWDNHGKDDRGIVASPAACHLLCEDDASCLQWLVDEKTNGTCLTTSRPNLGESSSGKTSGWVRERMQAFHDSEALCTDDGWIL